MLGDPEYFSFSRESLGYLFADDRTLAAILVLAAIALLRRNRVAWLMVLWTAALLALGEGYWLQAPLLSVTNLGAVLVLLYLPASLCRWLARASCRLAARWGVRRRWCCSCS